MKKIFVDGYFNLNLGDDLFIVALVEQFPDVKFTIIAPNNYIGMFSKYPNVSIKKIGKFSLKVHNFISNITKKRLWILHEQNKNDATVLIGGSLFIQNKEIYKKMLRNFIKEVNNSKYFIIGANFGPYYSNDYLEGYRKAFAKCQDVSLRDKKSFQLFKENINTRLNPDVVLSLKRNLICKSEKKIGISVIDLSNRDLSEYTNIYESALARLSEDLIRLGYHINFYSFCKEEGDSKAISRITDHIKENNYSVIEYDGDFEEYLKHLSQNEIMIATRYHAMILALLFRQRVISLSYSDKIVNVIQDLKINIPYYHIKDIENLTSVIVKNTPLMVVEEELFKSAERNFDILRKFIQE